MFILTRRPVTVIVIVTAAMEEESERQALHEQEDGVEGLGRTNTGFSPRGSLLAPAESVTIQTTVLRRCTASHSDIMSFWESLALHLFCHAGVRMCEKEAHRMPPRLISGT